MKTSQRFLLHRQNSIRTLSKNYAGIEFDIRTQSGRLGIGHDPGSKLVGVDDFFQTKKGGTLAVNLKEEGLIDDARGTLAKFEGKFFMFGASVPELVYQAGKNQAADLALRISDVEPIPPKGMLALFGWIWVDFFGVSSFPAKDLIDASSLGAKLVLASPELHAESNLSMSLNRRFQEIQDSGISFDLICTKDRHKYWPNL